jgi:tetratricopeptide (TPR) repeat protein
MTMDSGWFGVRLLVVGLVSVVVLGLLVPKAAVGHIGAAADGASDRGSDRTEDRLRAQAFDRFYNLDYDHAALDFQKLLDRHPNDPNAVNHLLAAVMYRELYRMGLLNPGEYTNNSFLVTPHRPADPKAKQQIEGLVARAEQLEEARLKANPKDVDALYARGITRAHFSIYTGLVQRAWFSALRNALGARHDHERVLELQPDYTSAKLVVGVHNYVMGSLPMAIKVAVSMVGLGGNKQKGIEYLYDVARSDSENRTEAQIALVLFLARERRYEESLTAVRPLIAEYPQNVILALAEGSLLRSLNRPSEAADVYRKVWQAGRAGKYGDLHYEFAALFLGDLLRNQKDYQGAAAAYEEVNEVPRADPDVLQKADLGAGEMYDLQKKRELAVQKYDAVIAMNSSNGPADTARKRLKEPYRVD